MLKFVVILRIIRLSDLDKQRIESAQRNGSVTVSEWDSLLKKVKLIIKSESLKKTWAFNTVTNQFIFTSKRVTFWSQKLYSGHPYVWKI